MFETNITKHKEIQ